jgi:hypothetical protein
MMREADFNIVRVAEFSEGVAALHSSQPITGYANK